MKAFFAILLIILLGIGLGFGIAKLRMRGDVWVPPNQTKQSSEGTTSRDELNLPQREPAQFACLAVDG